MHHSVRVPGFLSSRPDWLPSPTPYLQASVAPPFVPGGDTTRLRKRGQGEPIRTKGQTLWDSRYSIILLRWALLLLYKSCATCCTLCRVIQGFENVSAAALVIDIFHLLLVFSSGINAKIHILRRVSFFLFAVLFSTSLSSSDCSLVPSLSSSGCLLVPSLSSSDCLLVPSLSSSDCSLVPSLSSSDYLLVPSL